MIINLGKLLVRRENRASGYWEALRLVLGFIMFWAFLDKTFGLGMSTVLERAWTAGGSPTAGFLNNAISGNYFAGLFAAIQGPVVDWLFMLGLLGIGFSLLIGIGTRIAGYAGALMMVLLWLSLLPLSNNPIFDEHIVYAIVFLSFTQENVGYRFGMRAWWEKTEIVKRWPWLE